MDFIVELLIQLVVQFVVEVIADLLFESVVHGFASVVSSRVGRFVLGALAGLGFGIVWGHHLTGGASWPKLLWVSIALGSAALVLAMGRSREEPPAVEGSRLRRLWRDAVTPPWRWSADRLLGLFLINVGIATGILVSFRPAL